MHKEQQVSCLGEACFMAVES
uniref:Uncharacterized protein n=1 Tax=Arundo donax TaxID=35708 RepID=A0A0A9HLQ3_ARUDO